MCRTAALMVALAALAAAGARGVPVTPAAKSLRRSPAAVGVRTAHRSDTSHNGTSRKVTSRNVSLRSPHRIAPTHSYAASSHKPTPNEVGRAAGLAIRRQLAQEQTTRRWTKLREGQLRAVYRPVAERTTRRPLARYAARSIRSASTSPLFRSRPTEANEHESAETESAEARAVRSRAEHEAPRPDASRNPDAEVAFADRPALPEAARQAVAPGRDMAPAASESSEDLEGGAPERSSAGEAAEPAIAARDTGAAREAEEASLEIPRGAMPAPLLGSRASLERQNERAEAEGLERIQDEADLADRIARKLLIPVPVSSALAVNPDLPVNHRYCRPWTAQFLADLAQAHEAAFHKPLEVSSAVRTVEYQRQLMRINGNAAPAEGDLVSPHETGATVDIAKSGLSRSEIAWMRQRLLELEMAGKIDVEEEFKQACFHITVYKDYAPPETPRPASQAKAGTPKARRHKSAVAPGPAAAQGA